MLATRTGVVVFPQFGLPDQDWDATEMIVAGTKRTTATANMMMPTAPTTGEAGIKGRTGTMTIMEIAIVMTRTVHKITTRPGFPVPQD
jgi:hypothetical protein